MGNLCPPCRAASDEWLDYKLPARPVFANHAAYNDTARGMSDRRKARAEDWRSTIKHAQKVIRDGCAKGKHVESK